MLIIWGVHSFAVNIDKRNTLVIESGPGFSNHCRITCCSIVARAQFFILQLSAIETTCSGLLHRMKPEKIMHILSFHTSQEIPILNPINCLRLGASLHPVNCCLWEVMLLHYAASETIRRRLDHLLIDCTNTSLCPTLSTGDIVNAICTTTYLCSKIIVSKRMMVDFDNILQLLK